jgi:predicted porin
MNKKLLAAAIAACLVVPGLATADVKLFGKIQAETGNIDIDVQGAGDSDDTLMGNGGSGAIHGGGANEVGFKGTEKLGNGLTAYFKIDTEFSTFDSNTSFKARDTFVGVKGEGWHVQFGEMSSRYKVASGKYDPFYATGLQSRAVGAMGASHNGYATDVMEVGFKSSGWSGGFQITWEDSENDTGIAVNKGTADLGVSDEVDAGSWSGNIKYAANNWEAGFAYMDLDYGSGAGDADAWKVHGKWSGNGFMVNVQYEDADASTAAAGASPNPDGGKTIMGYLAGAEKSADPVVGSADSYDALHIAMTYDFSDATTLMARYANSEWDDLGGTAGADVDGDHWAVGVSHKLSKRTNVYGGYMDNEYDRSGGLADVDVDAWSIGLIHKF